MTSPAFISLIALFDAVCPPTYCWFIKMYLHSTQFGTFHITFQAWTDVKLTSPQLSRESLYKLALKNLALQCCSSRKFLLFMLRVYSTVQDHHFFLIYFKFSWMSLIILNFRSWNLYLCLHFLFCFFFLGGILLYTFSLLHLCSLLMVSVTFSNIWTTKWPSFD